MTPSSAWQRLPSEAEQLFGLALGLEQLTNLGRFLDLLEAWSARMNLVGPASRDEVIERHLLDSFGPAPLLGSARAIADYGSGAGFPAIPLAIAFPDAEFHLVESRRKRCSFLRHVERSLGLENVTVSENRGEEWKPPVPIDTVIGRALAPTTLASLAFQVLPSGGRLLVMRKQDATTELEGFAPRAVRRYRLPRGERHEVGAYERIS